MPKSATAAPAAQPVPPCELLESLHTIATGLGISDQVAGMIVSELHREWAGQQAYIPRNSDDRARHLSARNTAICRDYQRGESIAFLALRYKLTRRRIEQILAARNSLF